MASLKVWHFFPNPLGVDHNLTSLTYTDNYHAYGYVDFTNWGFPDTSIIVGAPTEYIAYLPVKYRTINNSTWHDYGTSVRYNTEIYDLMNISMFLTYELDGGTYDAVHVVGHWTVTDSANNRWKIDISMLAYSSKFEILAPHNNSYVDSNQIAIQGVNIYY